MRSACAGDPFQERVLVALQHHQLAAGGDVRDVKGTGGVGRDVRRQSPNIFASFARLANRVRMPCGCVSPDTVSRNQCR